MDARWVHSIEAFNLANENNILVVMDDCIMRRHLNIYKIDEAQ